jgi:hypothetical protein
MPPCECDPSNCYIDCSQRHICRWQREQIDYWCGLARPGDPVGRGVVCPGTGCQAAEVIAASTAACRRVATSASAALASTMHPCGIVETGIAVSETALLLV